MSNAAVTQQTNGVYIFMRDWQAQKHSQQDK